MKPKVKLRFRCQHKGEQVGYGDQKKVGTVKLSPVYAPEGSSEHPEMKAFYNATPSGQIEFATINERALAEFEVGQDYYVTLEKVEQ